MHAQMEVPIMAGHPMRGHLQEGEGRTMLKAEAQAWEARAKYRHRVVHCRLLQTRNAMTEQKSRHYGNPS